MSGDSKILQTGCRRSCSLLRLVDARGSCCRSEEDVRREREDREGGRERTRGLVKANLRSWYRRRWEMSCEWW